MDRIDQTDQMTSLQLAVREDFDELPSTGSAPDELASAELSVEASRVGPELPEGSRAASFVARYFSSALISIPPARVQTATRSSFRSGGQTLLSPLTGYRPFTDNESLLLIILDDLRRANFRFVRVKPDVAKGTSLAQKVPALIQFNLDLHEPLPIGFGVCPLLVQSVLLFDQALNMIEDRLIFGLILHERLLLGPLIWCAGLFCSFPSWNQTNQKHKISLASLSRRITRG